MILNTSYELSRTVHGIFLCRKILIVLFNEQFLYIFLHYLLRYVSNTYLSKVLFYITLFE